MINPTELMQSILTSEEAQIIIDHMSPIYGEARVFLWLLQAIGLALDEAESCKDDFDAQSLVAKATWSLKYYEDQYGLLTNTSLTDEQRRGNIFEFLKKLLATVLIEHDLSSLVPGEEAELVTMSSPNEDEGIINGKKNKGIARLPCDVERNKGYFGNL